MKDERNIIESEVPECFMVVARHFMMPGGIFDDGKGSIKGFFNTLKEADDFARDLFISTEKGLVDPRVWVLRCEKTYVRAKEGLAVVISK